MAEDNRGWDEEFDLVIVGSGGGGLSAGLTAASIGRSAVVIEKLPRIGGTTAKSGGVFWVPDNALMRAAGESDSLDDALAYLQEVSKEYQGPASAPERQMAYLVNAREMTDFFLREGIQLMYMDGWADHYPGGHPRGRLVGSTLFDAGRLGKWIDRFELYSTALPANALEVGKLMLVRRTMKGFLTGVKFALRSARDKLTGSRHVAMGAGIQGQLLLANLEKGTAVWTDTPVTRLITEGDRVVGVVALRDGRQIRVRGRNGVVLNAGSYARNQALRERYLPQPTKVEWSIAGEGDTGDLVDQLIELGARLELMDMGNWAPTGMMPNGEPTFLTHLFTKPHSMVVDPQGNRFFNEGNAGLYMVQTMYVRHKTIPTIPCWMIMDSTFFDYPFITVLPGQVPTDWIESGEMKVADTIEELAGACGIDPAQLRATTERFNGFARSGKDLDFQRGDWAYDKYYGDPTVKPNPSLGTIEKGPFYACKMYPGDGGLFGGVSTDTHARVQREDGSVIEGLYASGTTTASIFGYNYPCSGGAVGFSLAWGYMAARHALE